MSTFTPYRIKLASSGSTAQLRGVAGTQTDSIALDGSYIAGLQMHEFEVVVSGNYTLWEDPNGGVAYVRDADWSTTDGKFVAGVDIQDINQRLHGLRYGAQFNTLQEAVDDVAADGKVEASPGTVEIDVEVDIPEKVMLGGAGAGSVVKAVTGTTDTISVLSFEDAATLTGADIKNITLDGNNSVTTGNQEHKHLLNFNRYNKTTGYDLIAAKLRLKNSGGDGVYYRNVERGVFADSLIDVAYQRIGADLCGRNGVAIVDGRTLVIHGNIFRNAGNAGIDLEPALYGSENVKRVVISNCILEDCLYGIAVVSGIAGLGGITEVVISNCVIKVGDKSAGGFNSFTHGIIMESVQRVAINNVAIIGQDTLANTGNGITLYDCEDISMNNVIIHGCSRGIDCVPDYDANHRIKIIGGSVSGCYYDGIKIVGTAIDPSIGVDVQGVNAFNNSIGVPNTYYGIRTDYSNKVRISGCSTFDNQGSPTQRGGIYVDNADTVNVVDNMSYDNVTTQIRLISANITDLVYGHNNGTITWS